MAKQTFTTGQVLTAAQVNSLQANDFNQTVSVKTADYTLVAADKGTRIEFNTSGSVTCTVNTGLFDAGDTVIIQNRGSGTVTVTAGTATVNTNASLAVAQYGYGTLYFISASASIFFADAGGIPASAFTAKGDILVGTGSGTYDKLSVGANGTNIVADSTETTGLKWAAAAAGGKVLQVVQATYSTATTSTTTSLADTGLSVSITPSANTSKVLIMLTQFMEVERQAAYIGGRLVLNRDATKIFDPSDGSVSLSLDVSGQSDMYLRSLQNIVYLDSPSTTSATTYKTQFAVQDPNTGSTTVQRNSATSSIIAIEIGA